MKIAAFVIMLFLASAGAAERLVYPARQAPKPETRTIIGGLGENPDIEPLYAEFLTDADAVTPGSGGTLVQTIRNWPEPGKRIIVGKGEKITDAIRQRINADLPDLYEFTDPKAINYKNSVLKRAANAVLKPERSYQNFHDLAEAYRLTGEVKYRSAMASSLEHLRPIADNHYGMGLVIRGYDYWARGGEIPAALIHKADQIFLDYIADEAESWWRRSENRAVFADNRHHVYGTWGYLKTAQMLWRGLTEEQRDSETGHFLKKRIDECNAWFAACRREYRPTVLSTGVFINLNIFLLHAVQNCRGEISNDWLIELARLSAAAIDNTGGALGLSGYEDTYPGFWTKNYPVGGVLNLAAYLTGSPTIKYLRGILPGTDNNTWWNLSSDTHSWADGKASVPAGGFTGFQKTFGDAFPLYISYRNGFSPDDLFFCLTGSGTASIDAGDSGKGNQTYPGMLARLSWNALPFLVQNTNLPTLQNRNAPGIDRPGAAAGVRADLQYEKSGYIDGLDYLSVYAKDYCSVDWRRRILVKDNDFMLVADTFTARHDDQYSGVLTWRTPFMARRNADGCGIVFNGRELQLATHPGVEMRANRAPGKQGALRPDIIRQAFRAHLRENEDYTVGTLLYPGKKRYQLRRFGPKAFLLKLEDGSTALAGFDGFSGHGIQIDAPVFYRRVADSLWESATPGKSGPEAASPVKTDWVYDGFEPEWEELRDFRVSSAAAPRIAAVCTGNLDRAASVSGKSPLDVAVEFPGETHLERAVFIFAHDGGRGKWYLNPPQSTPRVEGGRANSPYLELDESYKGAPYSYSGTTVEVGQRKQRFHFKAEAKQLYQLRLYGGRKTAPETQAILPLGSGKVLARSGGNEIACLDIRTGNVLWQTRLPYEVRDWAAGDGLLALACLDSTVKTLDLRTGQPRWSCDTAAIPLGLPYSVAPLGKGFIASSYYHMTVIDADGKIQNPAQKILPGMWIYNVMGNVDLNGDGIPDAIGRALWGHVNLFDGKTGKVDYFANQLGPLVDWKLLKGPELLVVSTDGIGCYRANIRPELLHEGWPGAPDEDALLLEERSQRTVWRHSFENEITAFAEFENEFLIGFATGTVRAYTRDGKTAGAFLVDGPVKNLAVHGDRLLVNTGERIFRFDSKKRPDGVFACRNNGIYALPGGLLALTPGGVSKINLGSWKLQNYH